jgi:nitrogen fixation/metabolism regulation signal transduction histidine kinase
MLLKNYYIKIWIRVAGILLNCIAIAYLTLQNPDWLYLINLLVILAIQVYMLVRSQNSINRELEKLFDSLNSSDTTTRFIAKSSNAEFNSIYRKFDMVLEQIQALKVDSLQKSEYLSALFEHLSIGVLSLTSMGNIQMQNSSARRILGAQTLKNINDLSNLDVNFANTVRDISPNESKLVSIYSNGTLQQLSVKSTLLKFARDEIKIVSFQNIRNELDEREMEGWQKLIRVLTHELMNSVGPISSTISTISELLSPESLSPSKSDTISSDVLADIVQGLKIIDERSKGMLDFVTRFRSLTLIPNPEFALHKIDEIIVCITLLMKEEAEKRGVEIIFRTSQSNVMAKVDRGMVEQILINLIKNAFEALNDSPNPTVTISVWTDSSHFAYIDIADNGMGVPDNIQDKIFVPFFTTRKEGTGIGLSLSRQLAKVQGGALALTKSTTAGTVFTLRLRSSF